MGKKKLAARSWELKDWWPKACKERHCNLLLRRINLTCPVLIRTPNCNSFGVLLCVTLTISRLTLVDYQMFIPSFVRFASLFFPFFPEIRSEDPTWTVDLWPIDFLLLMRRGNTGSWSKMWCAKLHQNSDISRSATSYFWLGKCSYYRATWACVTKCRFYSIWD